MDSRLLDFQERIEHALRAIPLPAEPRNLYDPVRYIMALGGKRIRPVLTLFGAALFDDRPDKALPQALGIELFHNFTLIHDDIMDRADLRRGRKTVHRKWDDNIAILSGDAMQVKAYQFVADAPEEVVPGLLEIFSITALEVCEGQQLDMDFALRTELSEGEYLHMIRQKTAVLLSAALRIGAFRVGASEAELEKLHEFAINIGLAFQIRDDYLDAFGDQEKTGKEVGGDIREGKRTWMTVKAMNIAPAGQARILREAYSNENLQERVMQVQALYDELNVRQLTIEAIEDYSDRALAALMAVDGKETVKNDLRDLVNLLMDRSK